MKKDINSRLTRIHVLLPILILIIFLTYILISCKVVVGSGNIIIEERTVSGFDGISVSNSINLIIEQTGTEALRIEADDNVAPLVKTSIKNGELKINLTAASLRATAPIICYISVKDLRKISLSNSSELVCKELRTDELNMDMNNSSRGEITVYTDKIDAKITNSAHLDISGEAESQKIEVNNSGAYNAKELKSRECEVKAKNIGFATVNVSTQLNATVSTDGQVNYIGNPEVNTKISSEGKVINISE